MGPKIKLTGCPVNLSDKIDMGNGLKVKRINKHQKSNSTVLEITANEKEVFRKHKLAPHS